MPRHRCLLILLALYVLTAHTLTTGDGSPRGNEDAMPAGDSGGPPESSAASPLFIGAALATEKVMAPPPGDEFREPQWSPDGTRLAVMSGKGWLYLIRDTTRAVPELIATGDIREFKWSVDGEEILFIIGGRQNSQLHSYDVATGVPGLLRDGGTSFLGDLITLPQKRLGVAQRAGEAKGYSILDAQGNDVDFPNGAFAWLQSGKLGPFELWIKSPVFPQGRCISSSCKWVGLLMAPSGEIFSVMTNFGHPEKVSTTIMNMQGQILKAFHPTFYGSEWSRDSRYLFGWESVEDGENVLNSELAVYDTKDDVHVLLTNSADIQEWYPTFSEEQNRFAYVDAISGRLFISAVTRR